MPKPNGRKAQRDMLSAAGYKALASFRRQVRRYLAFTEANAQSAGLTSQQHQALLAIRAQTFSGSMTIRDLANELLIKHHSAVELIGRLEKAGLTTRSADEKDRRKVLLWLTATGERTLARLSAKNLRELRSIGADLPELLGQLQDGTAPGGQA
jgi:DNA-binding MarR family transcriptional regulator